MSLKKSLLKRLTFQFAKFAKYDYLDALNLRVCLIRNK